MNVQSLELISKLRMARKNSKTVPLEALSLEMLGKLAHRTVVNLPSKFQVEIIWIKKRKKTPV